MQQPSLNDLAALAEALRARSADNGGLADDLRSALSTTGARYTAAELASATGVPQSFADDLWRASGFVTSYPDEAAFDEQDRRALEVSYALLQSGLLSRELILQEARVFSQAMSTLTASLVELFTKAFDAVPGDEVGTENAPPIAPDAAALLVGVGEDILAHSYRRHLRQALRQADAERDNSHGHDSHAIVGFADLVGFTAGAQSLSDVELATLVNQFSEATSDAITEAGGRLVKTIGDEVMFVFDDIGAAATAALRMVLEIPASTGLDVRIGLACGPVVAHRGDVFGTTVNRASRLEHLALPGSVLVDEDIAETLDEFEHFDIRWLAARKVKGLGVQRFAVLRLPKGVTDTDDCSGVGPLPVLALPILQRRRPIRTRLLERQPHLLEDV